MAISRSQTDHRRCPACDAEVTTEIWFIVHRHERPKLWQRADSLRTLTCPNGHRGPVHGPLLLFDPASPFVLFSPSDAAFSPQAQVEGDLLMGMLWQSLPADQKKRRLNVEVAPAELLRFMLEAPRLNLGDFAPGSPEDEKALSVCSEIRSGNCSSAQLRAWIDDDRLHPSLRAGIQFELASHLGRAGLNDPNLMEEAIPQWRKVLRLYPRSDDPRRWAICNLELALCFANRREANPSANLQEASRLIDVALDILTLDQYPEDFALANSRKANLLLDMGSNSDLVTRSLSAFESALAVYTNGSYPEDWALAVSNMATAYLTRGGYKGVEDLQKAISLMEQVVKVRTRYVAPESWAITQMNLGLALSRLPVSDLGDSRQRAIDALRAAYDVFTELGVPARQLAAAYNLGMTLARFGEPATAEEASNRLEEALPWLKEVGHSGQSKDALDLLAQTYLSWLQNAHDIEQGDLISRRALSVLKLETGNAIAVQAIYQIGVWFLQHAKSSPERLGLAADCFELTIGSVHAIEDGDLRSAALANLATVLLVNEHGTDELNRIRARDTLNEALRILRSLPRNSEREERIGLILMNLMRSEL